MKTTGNLGLKKPDGTDIVDITDLNGNMDILDTAVKAVQDHAADAVKHITAAERAAWNAKASTAAATASAAGLMTAADKAKLDGVAPGANNYVHPNHTGDVTSTGDGVTAIAPGVIVDADVNSAAAIAWSKLSKAGASLADLPARSAADLSSGTLSAARLPAISGDITMAAGTGTAAITAGAIVNADVNAAAAIDATKIGTGLVSNTEFGYLDGVTSGIQGQLNGKANLATTPQQTTADITYYVRTDGNDGNTGLANSAAGAFRTIQKAINSIPYHVDHSVTVNVQPGTYPEDVRISDFNGSTEIYIYGGQNIAAAASYVVNSITVYGCVNQIFIQGFTSSTTTREAFAFVNSPFSQLVICRNVTTSTPKKVGVIASNGSTVRVSGCEFSNKSAAIHSTQGSTIVSVSNYAGTGNDTGLFASEGGKITKEGTQPGINSDHADNRGIITSGVLNPWGDNNTTSRSGVGAAAGAVAQVVASLVFTKVLFNSEYYDYLGEFTSSTFTPKQAGIYAISAVATFINAKDAFDAQLVMYKGGAPDTCLGRESTGQVTDCTVTGTTVTDLTAGQTIDIYVMHNQGTNISLSNDGRYTQVRIVRVA